MTVPKEFKFQVNFVTTIEFKLIDVFSRRMAEGNNLNDSQEKTVNLFGDIFIYDNITNKSKCILKKSNTTCATQLVGNRPFNLIRHVNTMHKELKLNINKNNSSAITPNKILEKCVEIITINGRPFSIFDDSGFSFFF